MQLPDATTERLLEYLSEHQEDIQGGYSATEIAAIRALAKGYVIDDALERVRALANDYTNSALARFTQSEESDLPHATRPEQLVTIDSSRAARLAIFERNPHARVVSIREGIVTVEAPHLFRVPDLPPGYGYKGGAARIALWALLGDSVSGFAPRDLDLVRFGKGSTTRDREMARQFMPEDSALGHGVEVVPSYRQYLATRDLTINEVALVDGKVVFSPRALEDTLNQILRPTSHLLGQGRLAGKVVTKMLRISAEERIRGRAMRVVDLPENVTVTPFDVALHLDRALQRGSRLAEVYLRTCIDFGFLTTSGGDICLGEAIQRLDSEVKGGVRGFKHLAPQRTPSQSSRRGPLGFRRR